MKIIVDPRQPLEFETSTGIGNFDGLHLGHRKIIDMVKDLAKQSSTRSCVITFDPHPQKVLGRREVPLIFPLEHRFRLLEFCGVQTVVCLNFTKELSAVSAENFVKNILIGLVRVKNIVVGPDFSFGHKRQGNTDLLKAMGETHNFNTIVSPQVQIDGHVASSSFIRNLLTEGKVCEANQFFGYDYFIEGLVVEGEKRGRKLGFPTINLDSDWETLPSPGVYATYVELPDGFHGSITNIGVRPTFGENRLAVETHIFDFSGDLYGKTIRVDFVQRIRDEKRFADVESLAKQISQDVILVKEILCSRVGKKKLV